MKNTMFAVVMAVLCFASINAFSQNQQDPFVGLSPAQKAQLLAQAEEMKNPMSKDNAKKVEQYAETWKLVGLSVAETAKQLGIAANDFVNTKAGMITIAMIGWHIAGKDFITLQNQLFRYVIGTFCMITWIVFWLFFFRRMCIIKEIVYSEDTKKKKQIIYYDVNKCEVDLHVTRIIMAACLILVCVIIWAAMFA